MLLVVVMAISEWNSPPRKLISIQSADQSWSLSHCEMWMHQRQINLMLVFH